MFRNYIGVLDPAFWRSKQSVITGIKYYIFILISLKVMSQLGVHIPFLPDLFFISLSSNDTIHLSTHVSVQYGRILHECIGMYFTSSKDE